MTALTLERLRSEGEKFSEEIARETLLAHAGHKPEAELEPIYRRHRDVTGSAALALATGQFHAAAPGTASQRSARTLLEWQVEVNVSRALVDLDEREIAWEARATIAVSDARTMLYQRAPIAIANSADRAERLAIDAARAKVAGAEHAPLRRARLQKERELVDSFGIAPGYIPTFESLTGIRLDRLSERCAEFLRQTQAMWDETFPRFTRQLLGIDPAAATRADASRLFRAAQFDGAFPGDAAAKSIRRQVSEMGIDPDVGGRIIYDLEERDGKQPRAFCAPVRVPHEVYLVLRPHGGQTDYTTLLHELGHALHFATVSPDLPFEFRWLGDNSVTETFAMLFDHRMHDQLWLRRYTDLRADSVSEFRRMMAFEELHFLRRYCAKLLYEREVYSDDIDAGRLEDLYVETLTGATSFRYRQEDAFVDLDPGFYSARYLRAWQLQALLAEALTQRFDVDWFRNPAAGPWLTGELMSHGQRETADEIAAMLGGELSFAPLVRAIENGLES